MSLSSRRGLLGTGSAALALALALPAAALADPGGNGYGPGGRPAASPAASPSASSASSPAAAPRKAAPAATGKPSKAPKASRAPRPAGAPAARPTTSPRPSSGGAQQPGTRPAGGDPRGNNGTIKIDGEAFDDGRGNEPHVGCTFAVDFYGFDAGQTADVVFTGQAPTGTGTLLSRSAVPVSDDAAGGGQDRDATLVFTAAQLGLTGVAPHRNGWHVKVAVDVREAPGGAKQKVFWLSCPTPASSTAASPAAAGSASPAALAAVTGGGGTSVEQVAPGPRRASTSRLGAAAPQGRGSGAVTVDAAPTASSRPLAAQGSGGRLLGGALPFTGAPLAVLLLLGGGAVAAGAAAVVAGRRRGAV